MIVHKIKFLISKLRNFIVGRNIKIIGAKNKFGYFFFNSRDFVIGRHLSYNKKLLNIDEINFLSNLIKKKKLTTMVNIGAHIGTICIPLSKKLKNIDAFEANSENCKLLRLNLIFNKINNINSYNVALGEKETKKYINIKETFNTGATHIGKKKSRNSEIQILTLDQLKKRYDIIYIDTEGYEYNILLGGSKTIKNCKVLVIEIAFDCLIRYDVKIENLTKKIAFFNHYFLFENKSNKFTRINRNNLISELENIHHKKTYNLFCIK